MALIISKAVRVKKSSPLIQIQLQKANPYRDPSTGRFTTGGAGAASAPSEIKVLEGSGYTENDKHTDIIYRAFHLDEDEEFTANGIEYYTSTGYKDVNTLLRKGKVQGISDFDRDLAQESIDALDKEIGLNKAPHDMVLFRGVSGHEASKTFDKLSAGDVFTDKGFVSTTPDVQMVREFMSSSLGGKFDSQVIQKGFVVQVHVPKGQNVFSVHKFFQNSGRDSDGMFERENEHILPRGTSFKVNGISTIQVRGNIVDKLIDVTVVPK